MERLQTYITHIQPMQNVRKNPCAEYSWTNSWDMGHKQALWFLPGKCTLDAVVKVMFDFTKAMVSNQSILAIFLDFAKAFDLVSHNILISKLDKQLITWITNWTAAYLTNRQQRVRMNNIEADWKSVEAGVIQGSVLGPILFLLFIAYINECIPNDVDFKKYADNIISYISGKSTTSQLPQQAVDAVQHWCLKNKMRLNTDKCKLLHISPKNEILPNITLMAFVWKQLTHTNTWASK
jgi:hypothetical protein